MSSRTRGGSRYPSAFGHTPSYRSYHTLGSSTALVDPPFPSALRSDLTRDKLFSDTSAFDTTLDRAFDRYDLGLPSTGLSGTGSTSASKVQSSSYTSKYSSVSDGGRPHVEYAADATHRSTATGPSGIPHSSFSHSSSSYDSDRPYRNRVNNYSYNI